MFFMLRSLHHPPQRMPNARAKGFGVVFLKQKLKFLQKLRISFCNAEHNTKSCDSGRRTFSLVFPDAHT